MTEAEEQATLDELERRYRDGDYSSGEMPVAYTQWLGSTEAPSEWWGRLPGHIREAIAGQLAARGGVFVGGEVSEASEAAYTHLLQRLAETLGIQVNG